MTVAGDTVALNISFEGLLFYDLIANDEKVASSKKHTQFNTRVRKPHPIYNQNGQNQYPIYDPKTAEKLYPLGPHVRI